MGTEAVGLKGKAALIGLRSTCWTSRQGPEAGSGSESAGVSLFSVSRMEFGVVFHLGL